MCASAGPRFWLLTGAGRLRRVRRREGVALHQLRDAHVGGLRHRRGRPGGAVSHDRSGRREEDAQLSGLVLLLGLLPPEGDLGRHHPLSLGDQGALGAVAIAPSTVSLVPLERRNDAVVATAGALRGALVALGGPQEKGGRDGAQHRVLGHQGGHVDAAAREAHAGGVLEKKRMCLFGTNSPSKIS
jgi:hypothetical protein